MLRQLRDNDEPVVATSRLGGIICSIKEFLLEIIPYRFNLDTIKGSMSTCLPAFDLTSFNDLPLGRISTSISPRHQPWRTGAYR